MLLFFVFQQGAARPEIKHHIGYLETHGDLEMPQLSHVEFRDANLLLFTPPAYSMCMYVLYTAAHMSPCGIVC